MGAPGDGVAGADGWSVPNEVVCLGVGVGECMN
jgi:hypothetical protein